MKKTQEILLHQIFQEINKTYFDSFLEPPTLTWNPRLRSSAGRFFGGSHGRSLSSHHSPARIEVATHLLREPNSLQLVRDVLSHEMIHYWLWVRQQPYGHTPQFLKKLNEMGAKRYHPLCRTPSHRVLYECPQCKWQVATEQPYENLACAACCTQYSNGHYHPKFKLVKRNETNT